MEPLKEAQIQSLIKEYLTRAGYFVFKVHQQGYRVHKGISDLVAIKCGHTVWIEVKTPTGKLSDDQLAFKRAVEEHGGRYIVARGVEDLVEVVRRGTNA
jgi:Holliday junction resolvase-like predicted endonuclease